MKSLSHLSHTAAIATLAKIQMNLEWPALSETLTIDLLWEFIEKSEVDYPRK
jgi:hypothetical protein